MSSPEQNYFSLFAMRYPVPKAIVLKNPVGNLKTEPPTEDTPLWKSFGLLVVFITGLAMIFYYLRVRRRRNQGFQPLNQKEDD